MKSRALPAIKSPNKQSNESDGREKLLERLNLAFKATKTAIWDWDIENNLAWSSPGNQLLFGLVNEESTDSFNIKDDDNPWVARLHRDDRARVLRCLHDHLENDAPYEVEYRYRLPDDEYIWIRSMGQAVRTPDGRALRMVGSNSDITAQKSAELEAQRFREAVDNASEGVVLYDADERFVFANKRYREMASAIAHLLTPGTHREEMRRHQSVGGTAELQLARGLWMKRSDHVLPDGSVVSVRTDITEIKRREQALRESEARFRAIFEDAAFGISIATVDDHVLSCNPALTSMLGYELGELDGIAWSTYTHPDDLAENMRLSDQLSRGEIDSFRMEKRFLRKDGSVLWARLTGTVVGDEVESARYRVAMIEDISERKAAEAAQKQSEERLRLITDNLPAFVAYIDTDGYYRFANKFYEDWFDLPIDKIVGCHIEDVIGPDNFAAISEAYHGVQRGKSITGLGEIESRDGRKAQFFANYVPDHAPDGDVRGYYVLSQDITQLSRAEETLRKREQNLRIITDNVPALIAYVDSQKRYRFVNRIFEEWFQVPLSSVLGARLEDVIGAKNYDRIREYVERALAGEQVSYEETITYPTGELRVIHATLVPDIDLKKNTVGYYALVIDITDLKKAEEAQRASLAHLNQAQRIAHIGSWEYHEVTDDLIWSDEVYQIFGLRQDEFQPTREKIQDLVHPEDRSTMIEARKRAAKGETDYSYEYRIIRPGGEVRTLRNTVFVVAREEDGKARRAGTVQDITEQVRTDEHLRQAMKMEAVGQLTGGVAHDFNNLLTVMLGNLELIRDKVEADDSVKGMIDRGIKVAERGAALTSRLLAFSRKQTLLPTTVDLNKLVTGMTDMLSRALGETIEIHTNVQSNLWMCLVDGSQLENALLNLSINARDAMPDGGILNIEIVNILLDDENSAAQAEVDLGQYVVLSVSDTGSGMSKETLAHAVEPFFTTKEVGKGSGLGLSMVYGFAKQSGGNATIHSAPGDGTTVKLYLPRSSAQKYPTASSAPASDSPSARGEKILVVEDDPEVRALAVAVLSGLGYEIAEAASAEEALDIFHHSATIDLLLSDVVLPGAMNGGHLAAEVERRSPLTKVIFMTGYAEEAFRGSAGADESTIVIQKPFSKANLARTVRNVLDDGNPRAQSTPSPSAVD